MNNQLQLIGIREDGCDRCFFCFTVLSTRNSSQFFFFIHSFRYRLVAMKLVDCLYTQWTRVEIHEFLNKKTYWFCILYCFQNCIVINKQTQALLFEQFLTEFKWNCCRLSMVIELIQIICSNRLFVLIKLPRTSSSLISGAKRFSSEKNTVNTGHGHTTFHWT